MKKLMGCVLVLSSLNAYAQVQLPDLNEVNERSAREVNNDSQSKINKTKAALKNYFIPKLSVHELPKARVLTDIELEQKELMACAGNFSDKNKGAYDGPAILAAILSSAMDGMTLSSDPAVLQDSTRLCLDAYKNLYGFKDKAMNTRKLKSALDSINADAKVKKFIKDLYLGVSTCVVKEVSATAAILVGANIGLANMSCLTPIGKVKNYLGVKFGIVGGGGFVVSYKENTTEDTSLGLVLGATAYDTSEYALIINALNDPRYSNDSHFFDDRSNSLQVGLGIFNTAGASLGVRVFNGKTRWGYLLDKLNK